MARPSSGRSNQQASIFLRSVAPGRDEIEWPLRTTMHKFRLGSLSRFSLRTLFVLVTVLAVGPPRWEKPKPSARENLQDIRRQSATSLSLLGTVGGGSISRRREAIGREIARRAAVMRGVLDKAFRGHHDSFVDQFLVCGVYRRKVWQER